MSYRMRSLAIVAVAAALSVCRPASAAELAWAKVGEALGKSGTEMAGGVYRVGL